jgi:short-subunit dehydrogenase
MKHIVITGASSGIGAALALAYACPELRLSLIARNGERLKAVAQSCRDQGAQVVECVLDVTEREAMSAWLIEQDREVPIDLIVANAGISGGSHALTDWEENTRDIFDVNLIGCLNTILPIIPRMIERGQGQIALMSSLAGFRGLASAPAYSASKVCVMAYGEALHLRYKSEGLLVNVICPGFVHSRITDKNTFKMPMIMTGDKAARLIVDGLKRNKAIITFPWPMALAARIYGILPLWIVSAVSSLLPKKE